MTKNDVDVNSIIEVQYNEVLSIFDLGWSKSTVFLLPTIDIYLNKRPELLKYFVNAYLKDNEYSEDFYRPLFLLFKVDDFKDLKWVNTQTFLRNNSNYILEYDVGVKDGEYLVMFVYQVPETFKDDYYLFKHGAYSKLSKRLKDLYTDKILDKDKKEILNIAYHASNKTSKIKELLKKIFNLEEEFIENLEECWDAPSKKTEYYR